MNTKFTSSYLVLLIVEKELFPSVLAYVPQERAQDVSYGNLNDYGDFV